MHLVEEGVAGISLVGQAHRVSSVEQLLSKMLAKQGVHYEILRESVFRYFTTHMVIFCESAIVWSGLRKGSGLYSLLKASL